MPNVLLNLNNLSEPYMPGDSFLIDEGDTSSLSGSITSPGTQNLFDSIATELTNGNNDSFAVVLFTLTPNNIGFEILKICFLEINPQVMKSLIITILFRVHLSHQ